jgi:hypothetical protein
MSNILFCHGYAIMNGIKKLKELCTLTIAWGRSPRSGIFGSNQTDCNISKYADDVYYMFVLYMHTFIIDQCITT